MRTAMRTAGSVFFGVLLAGTFALTWWLRGRVDGPRVPDAPAIVERVREVARLEALDVLLSKTVSYEPDPQPQDSILGAIATWAVYSVAAPEGRAIVVGVAHLSVDVSKLDATRVRVQGDTVEIDLPPVRTTVELIPERTEVIRSNLDSAETAALLAKARRALEADVAGDAALRGRARGAVEVSLGKLLKTLGFRHVRFGPAGNA